MADEKISELNAKVTIHAADLFVMVDSEATPDETKQITGANLMAQVIASDPEISAIAGLTSAANKLPYFTGGGAAALADFTAAGRSMVAAADAAAQLALLSGQATANFSFNDYNVLGVQQLRGCATHNLNIYANLTTADAAEKDMIFWTLDATGDVFIEVFRLEANSAAPTIKLNMNLDANGKAITGHVQVITDNSLLTIDGSPNDDEYGKFTANGLEGRTYAEMVTDILSSFADKIDKSHLSQDFGTSTLRLRAWNFTPKQGKAFQCTHGATSPFDASIAADGGGGGNLSSTNIPFDLETNLNCLKDIQTGATRWGRFVLHNTTKTESVQIVDFDHTNKFLTVEANSPDDANTWAEDDIIDTQSLTCTQAGYMDVDLSDEIATTVIEVYFAIAALDESAGAQAGRRLILHPYESYDAGKRVVCPAALASEFTVVPAIIPIVSQKVCVFFDDWTDFAPSLSVLATLEHADT